LSNVSPTGFVWRAGLLLAGAAYVASAARGPGWAGVVIAMWMFIAVDVVLQVVQRFTSRRPGLAQVRLDVDGCAQDDVPAGRSTVATLQRAWRLTQWPWMATGMVAMFATTPSGTAAAALTGLGVLAAVVAYRVVPDGHPAKPAWVTRFLYPYDSRSSLAAKWHEVTGFRVQPMRAGRFRLSVVSKAGDVVNIEVAITERQAGLLWNRIYVWRHRAPDSRSPGPSTRPQPVR
jgi:hypothetical protein